MDEKKVNEVPAPVDEKDVKEAPAPVDEQDVKDAPALMQEQTGGTTYPSKKVVLPAMVAIYLAVFLVALVSFPSSATLDYL